MRVAVAVDREVVGHADIEDPVAAVVGDGFGGLGHRFQEIILYRKISSHLCRLFCFYRLFRLKINIHSGHHRSLRHRKSVVDLIPLCQ